jgi:hypothetical protein
MFKVAIKMRSETKTFPKNFSMKATMPKISRVSALCLNRVHGSPDEAARQITQPRGEAQEI